MNVRQIVLGFIVFLVLGAFIILLLMLPKVESFSPIQAGGSQPNTTTIEMTFSRPMHTESVSEKLSISPQVEGKLTWQDNRTMRFIPEEPWPSGAQVQVRLENGAQSQLGLAVRQDLNWSFQISPVVMLYLWPASGGSDIFGLTLEDGETTQLTQSENVVGFVPSPDGQIIYYFTENSLGGNDLYRLDRFVHTKPENAQVVNPQRLLTCQRTLCNLPAVSPNGVLLAYLRNDSEIWLINLDTPADQIQISPEGQECHPPFWSPSGELSYYNAAEQAYTILNLETEEQTVIENQSGEKATWAPGGTALIAPETFTIETDILRGPSGEVSNQEVEEEELEPVRVLSTHLLVYQTSGSQVQDLSKDQLVEDFSPAFSPDGQYLAFTRRYLAQEPLALGRQVWLVSLPGSGSVAQALPLTNAPDYKYTALAWHPDGRQMATVRFNQASLTDPPEIWLLDLSGNAIRLVIGGFAPQWIQ
jgi:Tol biopolymer transport system component